MTSPGFSSTTTVGVWIFFIATNQSGLVTPSLARTTTFWLLAILGIPAARVVARACCRQVGGYILSPSDVFAFRWLLRIGMAKVQLNKGIEALAWFRRSIEANRNFPLAHFHLAAALAQLGSLNEARAAAQAGFALDPGFTVRRFRVGTSGNNPKYLAGRKRMLEGLLIAGVPEG